MQHLALLLALVSPAPDLFERVVDVLAERFYDEDFREAELPALVRRFAPLAERAESPEREREVVDALLGQIPVSHLALLSSATYAKMHDELNGRAAPTLGFQLVELEGAYFVHWLLEGGPADRMGLLRGDRILAIDGEPVARSRRLDWSSDDAALPDPNLHAVNCSRDELVLLDVERAPGLVNQLALRARNDSGFAASQRSVQVFEEEGFSIGYVHLWYIHMRGAAELVQNALEGPLAECEAWIFDLRGRGGSAAEVRRISQAVARASNRPLVLLTDSETRSAKEVLAYDLRAREDVLIVGETSAGAVIPATFQSVGDGATLMFPSFTLGRYTQLLEGKGVAPDIEVEDDLAYAAGRDAILDAGRSAAAAWLAELDASTVR